MRDLHGDVVAGGEACAHRRRNSRASSSRVRNLIASVGERAIPVA
jgi:hypothetical protein